MPLFVALIILFSYNMAHAANTPIGNVFCTTVGWMSGNLGVGIETIALLILGILALMGKISWQMAIIDAIGVAVLFGAAQLVAMSGAGAAAGCVIT